MPVFVEWRWKERTKSFLVIFHFYDDFSKPNLRLRKYEKGTIGMTIKSPYPDDPYGWTVEPKKAWMTWAPSHPELGLLMELLSYANMINGLRETEKRKLKIELQGRKTLTAMVRKGFASEDESIRSVCPDDIRKEIGRDKKTVFYFDPEIEPLNYTSVLNYVLNTSIISEGCWNHTSSKVLTEWRGVIGVTLPMFSPHTVMR